MIDFMIWASLGWGSIIIPGIGMSGLVLWGAIEFIWGPK